MVAIRLSYKLIVVALAGIPRKDINPRTKVLNRLDLTFLSLVSIDFKKSLYLSIEVPKLTNASLDCNSSWISACSSGLVVSYWLSLLMT